MVRDDLGIDKVFWDIDGEEKRKSVQYCGIF